MSRTYFRWLKTETPTRVWVNNPTLEEIDLALEQGAVGCKTNTAFRFGLVRRAPDEARPDIEDCVRRTADDHSASDATRRSARLGRPESAERWPSGLRRRS